MTSSPTTNEFGVVRQLLPERSRQQAAARRDLHLSAQADGAAGGGYYDAYSGVPLGFNSDGSHVLDPRPVAARPVEPRDPAIAAAAPRSDARTPPCGGGQVLVRHDKSVTGAGANGFGAVRAPLGAAAGTRHRWRAAKEGGVGWTPAGGVRFARGSEGQDPPGRHRSREARKHDEAHRMDGGGGGPVRVRRDAGARRRPAPTARDIQAAVDSYLASASQDATLVGGPGTAGYDEGFWIRGGDFLLRINLTLQARYEYFDYDTDEEGTLGASPRSRRVGAIRGWRRPLRLLAAARDAEVLG